MNMKILDFFLFLWVNFALLDPDPDPATQINADPCGFGSGSETLPGSIILKKNFGSRFRVAYFRLFSHYWPVLRIHNYFFFGSGSGSWIHNPEFWIHNPELRIRIQGRLFSHYWPVLRISNYYCGDPVPILDPESWIANPDSGSLIFTLLTSVADPQLFFLSGSRSWIHNTEMWIQNQIQEDSDPAQDPDPTWTFLLSLTKKCCQTNWYSSES